MHNRKNEIRVIKRDDVKSDEEYWFYLWLREAVEFGFVSDFAYEPRAYMISDELICDRKILMKTKTKIEKDTQFWQNHGKDGFDQSYTPDYVFYLTNKGKVYFGDNVFWQACQCQEGAYNEIHVDVKSSFNPYTGGSNAVFFLKQRLMWDRHSRYVFKINPKVWFKRTWAPESMRWMKARKLPTLTKLGTKTINSREYSKKHAWKMAASSQQETLKGLL